MRASHDCTTVARHSRACLKTVVIYSCERITTFVRILISFISRNYVSKWSYLCCIFVALCRLRKLSCNVFANICEGLRRVCYICGQVRVANMHRSRTGQSRKDYSGVISRGVGQLVLLPTRTITNPYLNFSYFIFSQSPYTLYILVNSSNTWTTSLYNIFRED